MSVGASTPVTQTVQQGTQALGRGAHATQDFERGAQGPQELGRRTQTVRRGALGDWSCRLAVAMLALLLAVVSTGCLTGNVGVKVKGDRSGEVNVEIFPNDELQKLLVAADGVTTVKNQVKEIDGATFTDVTVDGRIGYKVHIPFEDYQDLSAALKEGFSVAGVPVKVFTEFELSDLDGSWRLNATLAPDMLSDALKADPSLDQLLNSQGLAALNSDLILSIALPGKISRTNGNQTASGTATWGLKSGEAQQLTMVTVPKPLLTDVQKIFLGAGLAIVVGIMLVVWGSRRSWGAGAARKERKRAKRMTFGGPKPAATKWDNSGPMAPADEGTIPVSGPMPPRTIPTLQHSTAVSATAPPLTPPISSLPNVGPPVAPQGADPLAPNPFAPHRPGAPMPGDPLAGTVEHYGATPFVAPAAPAPAAPVAPVQPPAQESAPASPVVPAAQEPVAAAQAAPAQESAPAPEPAAAEPAAPVAPTQLPAPVQQPANAGFFDIEDFEDASPRAQASAAYFDASDTTATDVDRPGYFEQAPDSPGGLRFEPGPLPDQPTPAHHGAASAPTHDVDQSPGYDYAAAGDYDSSVTDAVPADSFEETSADVATFGESITYDDPYPGDPYTDDTYADDTRTVSTPAASTHTAGTPTIGTTGDESSTSGWFDQPDDGNAGHAVQRGAGWFDLDESLDDALVIDEPEHAADTNIYDASSSNVSGSERTTEVGSPTPEESVRDSSPPEGERIEFVEQVLADPSGLAPADFESALTDAFGPAPESFEAFAPEPADPASPAPDLQFEAFGPAPEPTGSAPDAFGPAPEPMGFASEPGEPPSGGEDIPADWYPDPDDANRYRWWDGVGWTDYVSERGS